MKTQELTERTAIEPEKLIGTKWIAWSELVGERISMKFVDRINCIYTSQPNEYPMTYTVTGGDMFFSHIEGSFELRGNVLFNNDLPVFEKAA
ncbi:MAG: hypothetical protein FWC19_00150 [Treponema sp.]|nr:hypothetical protein [Treponema sp.]